MLLNLWASGNTDYLLWHTFFVEEHWRATVALKDTLDHSSRSIILLTSSITSHDLCPPITSSCFWESIHSCTGQRTVLRIDNSKMETMKKATSPSCTCIEGIFCSSSAVQITQVGQKQALACVLIYQIYKGSNLSVAHIFNCCRQGNSEAKCIIGGYLIFYSNTKAKG